MENVPDRCVVCLVGRRRRYAKAENDVEAEGGVSRVWE
jgi:hypothetical protein